MITTIKNYYLAYGIKQSINSPFLKADFPLLKKVHALASVNDFILKDSCPFKTSISNIPLLFTITLLFKNLVNFFFFQIFFF